MNREQKKVVQLVCWTIAIILFVVFILMDINGGGLDEISDVIFGLVLPVLLIGTALFVRSSSKRPEG